MGRLALSRVRFCDRHCVASKYVAPGGSKVGEIGGANWSALAALPLRKTLDGKPLLPPLLPLHVLSLIKSRDPAQDAS
jgi:hypothetical protein